MGLWDKNIGTPGLHNISSGAPGFTVIKYSGLQALKSSGLLAVKAKISGLQGSSRVWKGFCVIRDLAEIERVIREYRKNPAVIRECYIGCDAGFPFSAVRDS